MDLPLAWREPGPPDGLGHAYSPVELGTETEIATAGHGQPYPLKAKPETKRLVLWDALSATGSDKPGGAGSQEKNGVAGIFFL